MRVRAKVRGLNRVRQQFERQGRRGTQAFRGAMYAEGLHIVGKATENAPAVTGRLRNSHFATVPDRRGGLTIGFGAKYAAAVEYGLRLINAARRQQKAAFASMRESGWRKSRVGGPAFFRRALGETNSGRVRRIAETAKRYYRAGIGVVLGDVPTRPGDGRG